MFAVPALLDGCHRTVGIHVAGTRAVAQFVLCVEDCAWLFPLLVRARLEIICMAGGAIRLEGREPPGNLLGICGVAIEAPDRRAMLGKTSPGMGEIDRRPVCGEVAFITFEIGHKVITVLTFSKSIIVAGRALASDI